jgi:hypothetical protein
MSQLAPVRSATNLHLLDGEGSARLVNARHAHRAARSQGWQPPPARTTSAGAASPVFTVASSASTRRSDVEMMAALVLCHIAVYDVDKYAALAPALRAVLTAVLQGG